MPKMLLHSAFPIPILTVFPYVFATIGDRTLHEMALQSDLEWSFSLTESLMHCKLQCNIECIL